MSKQKGLIVGVILIAIILMAIGYAALGGTGLTINGKAEASANTENFKVYFTGANTVESVNNVEGETEFIEVEAVAESVTATVNFLRGLGLDTVGESAYVILEIENGSNDIDASSVKVTTDATDKGVFDFTTAMCDENGTEITDGDYSVASGEKTYVKVSVKLLTSPTDDTEASISVALTATPADAK